jgi:hypothetical protein
MVFGWFSSGKRNSGDRSALMSRDPRILANPRGDKGIIAGSGHLSAASEAHGIDGLLASDLIAHDPSRDGERF